MSHEQSKSTNLTMHLESDLKALTEAHLEDKKYIQLLERELRNCSQEIEYLQDELNVRNVEANCMGEHVHSLELKLSEVGKLHEKVAELTEELAKSDSQRWSLMRALENKEKELQSSASHIEKLETAVSSIALESQCEIEGMKLDLIALEQRYLDAKKLNQQATQEKINMDALIEELEVRFEEAQKMIHNLENEKKKLQQKLMISEQNAKRLSDKVEEDVGMSLNNYNDPSFCNKLEGVFPALERMCTNGEVLDPFLSKLAVVPTWDENLKEEMQKISIRIHESELLVMQLKEELKKEKLKAKEEAEDLTQEMAELRYQITEMLEQECKRRARIEQASLHRIAELETQVRTEQSKSFVAIKHFHEAQALAKTKSLEVHYLKSALEGVHASGNMGKISGEIEACSCGECIASNPTGHFDVLMDANTGEEVSDVGTMYRPALGWHSEIDVSLGEAPNTSNEIE